MVNFDEVAPNLCNFISHNPLWEYVKYDWYNWHTISIKMLPLNLPRNSFLGENLAISAQVGPRLCNLISHDMI